MVELTVALVIAGVIGVALARLVINQSRFVSLQDGLMRARSGARSALAVMQDELRMVSDSGLRSAGRDSIMVRVPFVFGIACGYSTGQTVVGLLPADSASVAGAVANGMAWRDSVGNWRFVEPATMTAGAPTTVCTGQTPAITVISTPDWAAQAAYGTGTAPRIGSPVYFYQIVTYRFGPSVDLPGRRALWRAVASTGVREELVVPFDETAKFQFLVGTLSTVRTSPPAVLDSVLGVRVRLVAASDQTPAGHSGPVTFELNTDIVFRNHAH
jgi:hypothetical protein